MSYFDTSFLIDYLQEAQYALEHLDRNPTMARTAGVPAPALYELYVGVARQRGIDAISDAIDALSWTTTVPLTEEATIEAAAIERELVDNGQKIGSFDTLIAGAARSDDVALVTADTGFEHVPDLVVHNPRQ